jgi:hypothetical protein
MLRLHNRSEAEYDGITLSTCGFLFLGTPFCGSHEVEWNDILLDAAKTFSSARVDLIQQLNVFNPFNVLRKGDFASLKPQAPFYCFCEGSRTSAYRKRREV